MNTASSATRLPVAAQALAIQITALLLAIATQATFALPTLFTQPLLALTLSLAWRLPLWWLPVQAAFFPALLLSLQHELSPTLGLVLFLTLLTLNWNAFQQRVPLYLSGRAATLAINQHLPTGPLHFADLGCGLAGVLHFLARRHPQSFFYGFETSPIPYAIGRLRTLPLANCQVHRKDFWREPMDGYDVIYAYLSPEPMVELWNKLKGEMKPGALFISLEFDVPGVPADYEITLNNGKRLRIWAM